LRARLPNLLGSAKGALRPLGEVFANPDLRRLELAWGGFYVGDWAHVVALASRPQSDEDHLASLGCCEGWTSVVEGQSG
jgi:hypothetical protein